MLQAGWDPALGAAGGFPGMPSPVPAPGSVDAPLAGEQGMRGWGFAQILLEIGQNWSLLGGSLCISVKCRNKHNQVRSLDLEISNKLT